MKKLLGAVAMVALVGCGVDKADPFRDGVPRAEAVKIKTPGAGSALTAEGTRRDGLEGETAMFYSFTRGVTVMVNGGAGMVLNLVEQIVKHPATSVSQNQAVWGPHTDALSPNTWRLTVTRNAPNDHSYVFEGKGKTEPDSAFRVILSGSHVSAGPLLGNGTFLIDWDKAAQLPEHGREVGTAQFVYSRLTAGAETKVDAIFSNVRDDESGQLVDAQYGYVEQPGNGGSLDFTLNKNVAPGAAIEATTIRSRWQQSGAGRSDVRVTGGDLPAPATASECWDSGFLSRYFVLSFDPTKSYGAETVCAFATAEYSRL